MADHEASGHHSSQVILSLQLPFAVFPLVMFTTDRRKMGPLVAPAWVRPLAWDDTILRHAQQLAKLTGASLLLMHVADGWAARYGLPSAIRRQS